MEQLNGANAADIFDAEGSMGMSGGRMKETDSSFTVKSSSFGISGGRYIHSEMQRAAIKAARQLFLKAEKRGLPGARGSTVEFTLADITKGKGKRRSKPTLYSVKRTRKPSPTPMEWNSGNKIVSEWTYKADRLDTASSD